MSDRSLRQGIELVALAVAVTLMLLNVSPAGACQPRMLATPADVRISYNPFAVATPAPQVRMELQNQGDVDCELRLVFRDRAGAPLPAIDAAGVKLAFRADTASGLTERNLDPGAFGLRVPAGASARPAFDLVIVRDAVADAGEHPVEVMMDVTDPDGTPYLTMIPVRLSLYAEPRAQVNIAGAAGPYGSGSSVDVIDFGDAVAGGARQAFLQVRANTRSFITFQSENRGVMRHVELGEKGTTTPYRLQVDGQEIDLTQAVAVREVDPPRSFEGQSLLMLFTLGAIDGRMSGRYSDLITIDINPK